MKHFSGSAHAQHVMNIDLRVARVPSIPNASGSYHQRTIGKPFPENGLSLSSSAELVLTNDAATLASHLLLYTMPQATDVTDVQRLKERWPMVRLLVLVAKPNQQSLAQAAGADVVLPQGASPHQLREAIAALNERAS